MKPQLQAAPDLRWQRDKAPKQVDLLFQNSPLPMWVFDMESSFFLEVNSAAVQEYGYSRNEFLKLRVQDIMAGETHAPQATKTRARKKPPQNDSGKMRHRRKDGSIIEVELASNNLTYEGHKATLVVIKQAGEPRGAPTAVDEALNYAGTIITASPVGILTCKATGEVISVNEAAAKMVGAPAEQIQTQNFRKLRSWKDSGLLEAAELALSNRREQSIEAHGVSTFGQEFWFAARLIPFEYGGETHLLALLSDIREQKQAQQALQQSEARYRDLVENTQVLMCTHDLQGNLLSVNPWATQVLGYAAEDLIGKNIQDILAPETRPAFQGYLKYIRRHGTARGHMQVLTASGQKRIWEFDNTLRTEGVAKPIVRGTAYDITERQSAEEALRESEALYKLLFQATPIGIGLTDMSGHLVSFNDAILKPGGYSREDILKLDNIASIYAEPAQREQALALFRKQGYLTKHEVKFKRKDGSTYDAMLTLTKLDIQGQPRLQALVEDITERRAAEEALRRSEATLRALYNNALEGIFQTTPDGRFISTNPALVHMLGYESENDLLSLNVESVYFDPLARKRNTQKISETSEIRDLEIVLKRRDGKPLVVLENARAIRDAQGEVVSYEGVLTDITGRKQMEEALRASEGELSALVKAIPDLVLVLDKDGRYLKVATGDGNLLYAPMDELLGKRFHDIFSTPKADEFVSYIQMALKTGKPVQFEYALLIGDRIKWFSGTTAPLTEDTVVWVARDITPQKQAEEQVQRRLADLETVYESGLSLSQSLDPREISRKVIAILSKRLNWHHAAVRVRRGDSDDVELLAFGEAHGEAGSAGDGQSLAQAAITKIGQGMAGWVMKHGRSINSGDLSEDPRYHETFPNMFSGLYVPIWAGGRVLGCLSVESGQHEAFTEADELLLTTLASQAAAALENARLFAETRQRAAQSLALYEVTRDLTTQDDLPTLLQTLAAKIAMLMDVVGGAVYLYQAETDELENVVATHASLPIGTRLKMGEGMAGRVAQNREPLIVDDYKTWDGRSPQYVAQPFAAVLEVPMLYRGELIGVMVAYNLHSDGPTLEEKNRKFGEADVQLLSLFAGGAAAAVYSARLFEAERVRRREAESLRAAAVRSAERLATLHAATREIARISQDPEQVYASIHQAASRLVPTEAFTITLVDEAHNQIDGVYLIDRDGRSPSLKIPFGQGFSSQVILSGETILLKDLESATISRVHFGTLEHSRSVLAVPLRVGGQIIGAMSAQNYLPDVYNEEDQVLFEMLAAQAAIAIQNARLFSEARGRAEEFQALYEMANDVAVQRDVSSLLQTIVGRAAELLHTSRGGIYLYDADREDLESTVRVGLEISTGIRLKLGEGAAGRVAQTREPLIIDDYQTWPGRSSQYEGVPLRAILHVPMLYHGDLIGVLTVDEYGADSTRKFTQEDARLLSLFASHAAATIHNARLFDQTRRRLHELESLAKVGDALTGTLELEPLLENILRTARQAIPAAEKGTILLRGDNEEGHLHMRAQVGYEDARLKEAPFDDSKGYSGRAFHEKHSILIRDSLAEYEIPFNRQFEEVNAVQSAIVAPLIVKDETIGVIALDNASRISAFDEEDLRLLMLFASSAAVVIENARLFGETRRRAQEFEILYGATRDIGSHQQDLSSLLPILIERAANLLRAYGAGMYLYDAAREDLELAVVTKGTQGLGEHVRLGDGAVGRVAQTRTPLVIEDYQTWEGRRPLLEGTPYRALVQVPMIYGGDLIGVLDVYEYGDSERKFSEADVRLLSLFAAHAASAVHDARLFDETRKKASQFASLYETARDLSGQRNVNQLLETIVERAGTLLNAPVSGIYLYDKVGNDLYVAVNRGLSTSLGIRLAIGEGVAGRVAQSRQPFIIEDYQKWEGRSPHYEDVPLRSVLEVPMLYSGELIGVLTVNEIGDSERKFTQDDAHLLSLFASYAAGAVHTARLFEEISMRASEFEALYQTAADVSSQTDLQTLLNTIIQRSRILMGAAGGGVYLFDPQLGDLELAAIDDPDLHPGLRYNMGEGVSGKVAQTRRPLIVKDYQTWEGRSPQYEGIPLTTTLGVPMLYSGELIGVLNLFNRADNNSPDNGDKFDEQHLNLLSLFANAAAGAVYGARLLDQTRRRVEQLSALHAVDIAIGSTTDLRLSLQSVLENLTRQLHVDAADVLLLNPASLTLQYATGMGFFTSDISRTASSIGKGQAGKAALERQMVYIPDLTAENTGFLRSNLIAAERFKAYLAVPLIAKGEVKGVLEIFQRAPLNLDDERKSFLEMLAGQAALAVDNAQLFEGLEKANVELTMAYDATIEGWSQALELRDQETQGHSDRVLGLTLRLATAMGLSDREMQAIRRGVLLHDIGKMGIPDAILHKPGPLTDEEWRIMRQHPQFAYDMLAPIVYLRNALDIPYSHHEKWDGTGYPRGLKAESIPLSARIFSVVDVYDALTSNRPYRGAWSKEKTVEYIIEQSGKHFDPHVVDMFLKLIED